MKLLSLSIILAMAIGLGAKQVDIQEVYKVESLKIHQNSCTDMEEEISQYCKNQCGTCKQSIDQ